MATQPKPQVGDIWEVKRPGKRKIVKEIDSVDTIWSHTSQTQIPYVNGWRANKGRYSGITVKGLLEFGRRISTKTERNARDLAWRERQEAARKNNK